MTQKQPWAKSDDQPFIDLDDGKIYRDPPCLMGKTIVSCIFSHWTMIFFGGFLWTNWATSPGSTRYSRQVERASTESHCCRGTQMCKKTISKSLVFGYSMKTLVVFGGQNSGPGNHKIPRGNRFGNFFWLTTASAYGRFIESLWLVLEDGPFVWPTWGPKLLNMGSSKSLRTSLDIC